MPPELPDTFRALGDPTRLAVVRLLTSEPHRSSEVADALGVSRAVASKHLRALHDAGLIEGLPVPGDARGRIYALRPEPFGEIRGFLEGVEAFWNDQLSAFQAHIERDR